MLFIKDLTNNFDESIRQNPDSSTAVCAIKVLLDYIKQEPFGTVTELREKVIKAIDTLTTTDSSAISIKSGCELLLRFITLTALDAGVDASMEECKEVLLQNGALFLTKCKESREKIARLASSWIRNGSVGLSAYIVFNYQRSCRLTCANQF